MKRRSSRRRWHIAAAARCCAAAAAHYSEGRCNRGENADHCPYSGHLLDRLEESGRSLTSVGNRHDACVPGAEAPSLSPDGHCLLLAPGSFPKNATRQQRMQRRKGTRPWPVITPAGMKSVHRHPIYWARTTRGGGQARGLPGCLRGGRMPQAARTFTKESRSESRTDMSTGLLICNVGRGGRRRGEGEGERSVGNSTSCCLRFAAPSPARVIIKLQRMQRQLRSGAVRTSASAPLAA